MAKQQKNKKIPLVRITSLGCPKNFVDSEQAAASLLMQGYGIAHDDESADVLFINTCAFLRSAREEAAEQLRMGGKWKAEKPNRLLIVGGCLPAWDKDHEAAKEFPYVDAWLPPEHVSALGETLQKLKTVGRKSFCAPAGSPDAPRLILTPPHYAWLRVADGCCNCCTYCLIPSIRGPLKSRSTDSVIQEAGSLIANGTRELFVIAQDTASFGRDLTGRSELPELLRRLDSIDGDFLFRVLYLHPAHVTKELLDTMDACDHLIPCLEMPIQHISDPVLKRMNRHIGEARLRRLLDDIRDRGYMLRTTLMTGFPGETEEDFAKLHALVKEQEFERLGVFAYSPEEGTPGYSMRNPVPAEVAEKRMAILLKEQKKISLKQNKRFLDKEIIVIVDEEYGDGTGAGRTLCDLPDIDGLVQLTGVPEGAAGEILSAVVHKASAYDLEATITTKEN